MKGKEFLRPNIKKIILFIILLVFGLLLLGFSSGFGYFNPIFFYLSLILNWPLILILLVNESTAFLVIAYTITVLYNYILACFVYSIFRRK